MSEHNNNNTANDFHTVVNDEIDLREIVAVIRSHKLFIFIVTMIVLVMAWIFTLHLQPKYESSALLQVANSSDTTGLNAALQSMSDMKMVLGQGNAQPSDVETALMRSRFVLQPVITKNRLSITVLPRYFPIIGSYLARRYVFAQRSRGQKVVLSKPFWGLNSFAWGGEQIQVKRFNVPDIYFNKKFGLVAGKNGNYKLYSVNGDLVLSGKVGKMAVAKSPLYTGLKLLVTSLTARHGVKFFLIREPDEKTLANLLKDFTIQDLGGKNKTGVLSLLLVGTNRSNLSNVLNTILNVEAANNVRKKTEEAQKTLTFLNKQLPILKHALNRAEMALDTYRARTGSIGIGTEGKILLEQIVTAEQGLEKIKLDRAQLLQEFTAKHPYVIITTQKERKLRSEINLLKNRLRLLPLTEQKAIALEREVKVKNQLYLLLLSKIQQLQMVKAGTIGDVRILDKATPPMQLSNHKMLILMGGAILGFILSIILIFIRKLLARAVDDPDYVEEQLGIPSYAVVPHSRKQEQLFKDMRRKLPVNRPFVLSAVKPRDPSIESIRSLRTTLQFALHEAKNNVISIMGSSPGIGKSFISTNLSFVLSDSNKRVLLIDADLRKGKLCNYLVQPQSPGLAELLQNRAKSSDIVNTVRDGRLDFISTGRYPDHPSELLMNDVFYNNLDEWSKQYDIVVIDTPPILAVTEGVLIAKHTGINLLLVGSGKDTLKELSHAVKRIQKNGVEIKGLIFNNTMQTRGAYGNYNYNYYYEYKS